MGYYYLAKVTYNGTATSYLQDTVVLQETIGAGTPSSYFYSLGSTSPLLQTTASGTTAWYHRDGLGSMRVMSDSTGSTLNTATYSAFGTTTAQTGTTPNSHLFAGEQLDPTGLSFNRARYYDPTTGRFTQHDTFFGSMGMPQSLNRFAYVQNNPTGLVDPDGNAPHKWCQTEDDSGDCPSDGSGGGQSGTCADPTYAQTYPEECGTAQGGGSGSQGGGRNAGEGDPGAAPDNKMPPPVTKPGCQQQPEGCPSCRIEIRIDHFHLFLVFTGAKLVSVDSSRRAVFEGGPGGAHNDGYIKAGERSYEAKDDIANWGNISPKLTDGQAGGSHIIAEGPSICSKEQALYDAAKLIVSWEIPYVMDLRNSNSVVRTLLHNSNLPKE